MNRTIFSLAALLTLSIVVSTATADVVHWTGAGPNDDWSDQENWDFYGVLPGADDIAYFDNVGAQTLPNILTNSLSADHTIGGLTYDNNGRYHTTDLGGHTLTVAGDINFNVNQPGHTTTILRNGNLHVDDPLGYVNAGRSDIGGAWTNVSLGALDSFTAEIKEFHVGTKLSGSAYGELTLAETNEITADKVIVGYDGTGKLHLGLENHILADEVVIGEQLSDAMVDIRNGGMLNLGSPSRRTSLSIGTGTWSYGWTYSSTLDLTGATFNAYLDHLIVGQKDDRTGAYMATLIGGDSGSVSVGEPGNTANMVVGGTRSTGRVNFSGLDDFTANLDQMLIGTGPGANGSLQLADVNTIDAKRITVGDGSNATLSLGLENHILADEFAIGKQGSDAMVDIRNGGVLNLGSPSRRTSLSIGTGTWSYGWTYSSTLDLAGATFNAHLDHLIVGQKDDRTGAYMATLIGGDSGSVSVGAPGNTANMIIGGTRSTGKVDFSGLDEFTANLDQMLIGTGPGANGTLQLARLNTIDARRVAVGERSPGKMTLGSHNTILADEVVIGKDGTDALVDIQSGGVLNLGTPSRRTNLFIATGVWSYGWTYSCSLDLSGATVNAYLNQVILGQKDDRTGNYTATLSLSDHDDNYVDIVSLLIGDTRSTGTLEFAGGTMVAGKIEKGAGTANFDWTGGTLHVGTFGTPVKSFDLINEGSGTLAPGTSVGTTEVFGDYRQELFASMEMEILSPVSFDLLIVHEELDLEGTLLVEFPAGAVIGQFPIVEYGSLTGRFDEILVPALSPGDYSIDYGSGTNDVITLTSTVPEPSTVALLAAGLAGLLLWARRRR